MPRLCGGQGRAHLHEAARHLHFPPAKTAKDDAADGIRISNLHDPGNILHYPRASAPEMDSESIGDAVHGMCVNTSEGRGEHHAGDGQVDFPKVMANRAPPVSRAGRSSNA